MVKLDQDLDLDPDPHSEKLLDPDPHKMNADPQPCRKPIQNLTIYFGDVAQFDTGTEPIPQSIKH